MKITQRIILITIIPLIISTSVSAAIITEITTDQLFDSTISKIQSLCQLTESEMRNPMNRLDVDELNEIVDNLEEDENIIQVLVLFPDGRLLTDGTDHDFNYGTISEDEFVQNSVSSDKELQIINDEMIRVSKPIILDEKIGILVLDYSTKSINKNIENSIMNIILISTIIISISIVISIFLSRSISKPILKIKKMVDNISKGNLKNQKIQSRIPEINDLSKEILEMGKSIENYQKELIKNERLSTVGEMSARITHDLRNPLTAIKNSVAIMKKKNPEKIKENQQYFDMIQDAVGRMSHQIDEVLGFVKVKEPKKIFVKFSNIVSKILESTIIPTNIKISTGNIEKEIWCDKIQMQNVLTNLITNSIQAIDKNEGLIKIDLEEEKEFDKITVKDNGRGIPENLLDTVFEPLYTTKQNGTGLGLVSCKSTIESHNGKIYAQNSPEGGVIFTILLPNIRKSETN